MADIKINGATPSGFYFGSTAASAVYYGSTKLWEAVTPMADNTIMFRFSDSSYDPSSLTTLTNATWTQVSSSPNVWLWDGSSVVETDWSQAFYRKFRNINTDVDLIDAGKLTTPTILASQSGSTYYGLFAGCTNLKSVAVPLDIPNATDCRRIFHLCTSLAGSVSLNVPSATTIEDCFGGSNTNSNKVTSISVTTSSSLTSTKQMCRGCKLLTSFSISNMSSVTDASSMFNGCTALPSVVLPNLNALTTVTSIFNSCTSLASVTMPNTSSLTNAGGLFGSLTALTTVSMSDTSAVTNMSSMFYHCTSLTTVSLNTPDVTNMSQMFRGCTSLTTVSLSDTSDVTNMSQMFQACTSLVTAPSLNTSAVTNMSKMFYGCTALTSVPSLNTSAVTNMSYMFYGCTALTSIPSLNTTTVIDVSYMFDGCVNVASGSLAMYNQMSSQATPPTTYHDCFTDCGSNTTTGAAELAQIPLAWGGTYVAPVAARTLRLKYSTGTTPASSANWTVTTVSAYHGLYDITSTRTTDMSVNSSADALPSYASITEVVGQGDCSGVTNCYKLFDHCTSLTRVCSLSFQDATTVQNLFSDCTSLTTVDGFSAGSALVNTNSMFLNCTALTAAPLFDTSHVTNIRYMLNTCSSITSLPQYNVSSVEQCAAAFTNTLLVSGGALALYNQLKTNTIYDSTSRTFFNCGSDTVTGAAELAQIPSSWGGTAA